MPLPERTEVEMAAEFDRLCAQYPSLEDNLDMARLVFNAGAHWACCFIQQELGNDSKVNLEEEGA